MQRGLGFPGGCKPLGGDKEGKLGLNNSNIKGEC